MSKARFRVVKSYNKTSSAGGIGDTGLDNTCLIINEDTNESNNDNGIYLGDFNKCIANYTSPISEEYIKSIFGNLVSSGAPINEALIEDAEQ